MASDLLTGHFIPKAVVCRRYERGLSNLFDIYLPLATTWRVYDNSNSPGMRLIASGGRATSDEIHDDEAWRQVRRADREE